MKTSKKDSCGHKLNVLQHSQTDVHQLVQFRTAALVQVSAALVALVHQLTQHFHRVSRSGVAHALKPHHPRSFAVHVFGPLVELEVRHWLREAGLNIILSSNLIVRKFYDLLKVT